MCFSFNCFRTFSKTPDREYECRNSTNFIKFPIYNGQIHFVKDTICEFLECTTSGHDTDLSSMSLDTDDSKSSTSGCQFTKTTSCSIDHSHFSNANERALKSNECVSAHWNPKLMKNHKPYFQKKIITE